MIAGTLCNWATQIKFYFGWDDALDVRFQPVEHIHVANGRYAQIFASHAIGGVVGNILTGIFAQASIAEADGFTVIRGGWLDGNWIQLGYQLANSAFGMSYSFVVTVRCSSFICHNHC